MKYMMFLVAFIIFFGGISYIVFEILRKFNKAQ